jgi:hypothetical protein
LDPCFRPDSKGEQQFLLWTWLIYSATVGKVLVLAIHMIASIHLTISSLTAKKDQELVSVEVSFQHQNQVQVATSGVNVSMLLVC